MGRRPGTVLRMGNEAVSARVIVEVVAGVIPEKPEAEFTRRWALTSDEWATAEREGRSAEALAVLNGKAQGYAALYMLQPDRVNWVRTDWIWL
jgi:hypothetical protein